VNRDCPEDPFEDALIDAGHRFGWRAHAERRSRSASGKHATAIKGDRGWPDVVLAHESKGLVIVELKAQTGSFGEGQIDWLETIDRAAGTGRVLVAVWRPCDWEFIVVCLQYGVDVYRKLVAEIPLPSTVGRRKLPDLS
jgi:hypothetical protein